MKNLLSISAACLILLSSCDNHEVQRASLLEYRNNGVYNSYKGYVKRYSVYVNSVKKGNLWHFGQYGTGISIWARDTTSLKTLYPYTDITAVLTQPIGDGVGVKTYNPVSGQFRMVGLVEYDITGDFNFKFKLPSYPNDSVMITAGFFRIFLEFADTTLAE